MNAMATNSELNEHDVANTVTCSRDRDLSLHQHEVTVTP